VKRGAALAPEGMSSSQVSPSENLIGASLAASGRIWIEYVQRLDQRVFSGLLSVNLIVENYV